MAAIPGAGAFPARRILFIHQNFPAQFVHLAAALAALGCEVKALAIGGRDVPGVDVRRYTTPVKPVLARQHPLADMEVKVLRAAACTSAMRSLAAEGFAPDLVIAHPGWGESLFCRDIWPDALLVAYGEFYYRSSGGDYAFDPEFSTDSEEGRIRLRLRNTALLHAYAAADYILCPTQWQRSCLPPDVQHKAVAIFDGIDTKLAAPDARASIRLARADLELTPKDSVLTFVNRNLEPHRGFHVFMRALPEILARNPKTHCIVVGEDNISYGERPRRFRNWREAMLHEVGERLPADRVHFVGRLAYADYLRVLQVSTCHVYMTYPFVLSWSCLEALSARCRVVASDTEPVREVIRHGRNGLLFGFFDQAALIERVGEVLEDPGRFDAMAAKGRMVAQRDYDLETVCKPRQLQWLASICQQRAAAA